MKTLYFEGAGWEGAELSKKTIGNCRIRTAFHLDNGKAVYLEILGAEMNKKRAKLFNNMKYVGFIDFLHYIEGKIDKDDNCNYARLPQERKVTIEYSLEGIKNFVNSLGASFDKIEVLPYLAGYRVHRSYNKKNIYNKEKYNYGDEFIPNWDVVKNGKEINDYIYKIEKEEGKEFPNFSLYNDEEDITKLHLVRHYNGYNKNWEINALSPDWLKEYKEQKAKIS